MRITVPVTLTVEVEFDMDEHEAACLSGESDPGQQHLIERTREAIQECLHDEPSLADDMVERITNETGWCLRAFSMVAR